MNVPLETDVVLLSDLTTLEEDAFAYDTGYIFVPFRNDAKENGMAGDSDMPFSHDDAYSAVFTLMM